MVPRFHCTYPWVKCQCKHKEKPPFDGTQLRISFHMNNTILNITTAIRHTPHSLRKSHSYIVMCQYKK